MKLLKVYILKWRCRTYSHNLWSFLNSVSSWNNTIAPCSSCEQCGRIRTGDVFCFPKFWRKSFGASLSLRIFSVRIFCEANVASEKQHNQDLRRLHRRGYVFSNSSLFTRMHCILRECIALVRTTRGCHIVFAHRFQWEMVISGHVFLWFSCKTMWRRSCFTLSLQLLRLFLMQYVKSFRNLDDLLFRSLRASLVKFLIKN